PGDKTSSRIDAARSGHVTGWIKVPDGMMEFEICPKQADTQAQIQCQAFGRVPIVLKVRFQNLVAVIGFDRGFLLSELRNITQKHVRKRIARRYRRADIVGEKTIGRIRRLGYLVFLCRYEISAKLQVMRANNLGYVVTQCVSRVRI